MSDSVVIPQASVPTAPAPEAAPSLPPEIAYLQAHGMDSEATSLAAELEGLLKSRDEAPAVVPTQAPITQPPAPQPVHPNTDPAAPQTALEKALDPYAADGGDGDDPAVVIDEQGRARDAVTGKYVPIKALHKERDLHKQTRTELQQTREQNARVEERLAILNEILSAEDKPAAPAPAPVEERPTLEEPVDPEVDIFKWAKQQQEFAKKQNDYIAKLEAKLQNTDKTTSEQIAEMNLQTALRNDVTAFNARNADFMKAYDHLRTVRDNALKTLGFTDEKVRQTQLAREERGLAMDAMKSGKSFAQVLYDLSTAYGYTKPAPAPTPDPTPAPQATPPAPVAPSIDPTAAAKVQALAAAKESAASLNGHGGSGGEGLTVSQLASMSEDDFLNLAAKLGGKSKMDAFFRKA